MEIPKPKYWIGDVVVHAFEDLDDNTIEPQMSIIEEALLIGASWHYIVRGGYTLLESDILYKKT